MQRGCLSEEERRPSAAQADRLVCVTEGSMRPCAVISTGRTESQHCSFLLHFYYWGLSFREAVQKSFDLHIFIFLNFCLHLFYAWCINYINGEGNVTPLQYSCLKIPMDGGAWKTAVHGVTRVGHDWATSLSLFTCMHWRRKWQPIPVFLPGESQGWGSLVGCCLWGR